MVICYFNKKSVLTSYDTESTNDIVEWMFMQAPDHLWTDIIWLLTNYLNIH